MILIVISELLFGSERLWEVLRYGYLCCYIRLFVCIKLRRQLHWDILCIQNSSFINWVYLIPLIVTFFWDTIRRWLIKKCKKVSQTDWFNSYLSPQDAGAFVMAVCELSGQMLVYSHQKYQDIDEQEIVSAMRSTTLQTFTQLFDRIKHLLLGEDWWQKLFFRNKVTASFFMI